MNINDTVPGSSYRIKTSSGLDLTIELEKISHVADVIKEDHVDIMTTIVNEKVLSEAEMNRIRNVNVDNVDQDSSIGDLAILNGYLAGKPLYVGVVTDIIKGLGYSIEKGNRFIFWKEIVTDVLPVDIEYIWRVHAMIKANDINGSKKIEEGLKLVVGDTGKVAMSGYGNDKKLDSSVLNADLQRERLLEGLHDHITELDKRINTMTKLSDLWTNAEVFDQIGEINKAMDALSTRVKKFLV